MADIESSRSRFADVADLATASPLPRRTFLSVALAAAAAGVTGCNFSGSDQPQANQSANEGGPTGSANQTLRQSMAPVTFIDPAFAGASTDGHLLYTGLMEGLVIRDPDNGEDVLPGAAEKWEISDDGLTYTFHLRSATWSNGDPVTAEDFVWNAERGFSPDTAKGSQNAPSFGSPDALEIKGAADFFAGQSKDFSTVAFAAPDKQTVTVTLVQPDPSFLAGLANWRWLPLHPQTVKDHPKDFADPKNWVGNGAYVLDSWRANAGGALKRNEKYWDKASYSIGTWKATFNSGGDTAQMVSYKADEVDIFRVEGDPAAFLSDPEVGKQLKTAPATQFKCLVLMPSKNPVLENIKVRQALSLAIDRDAVAKVGAPDLPGGCLVPKGVAGYDQIQMTSFDPDRAKQLLADAGHAGGTGIPTINLLVFENTPWLEAVGEMWKKNLGISTRVDLVDVGVYGTKRLAVQPKDYVGFSYGYFGLNSPTMYWFAQNQWFNNFAMPGAAVQQFNDVTANTKLTPGQQKAAQAKIMAKNWWPEYKAYADLVTEAKAAAADPDKATQIATQAANALEKTYVALPVLWAGYSFMIKPTIQNLTITSYPEELFRLKGVTISA